jgi:hypothetical protein
MKAILDMGEVKLDGIICPGHVSAIIGSYPYQFIPDNYNIACVVSGFEPLDILLCVDMLVEQIETEDTFLCYRLASALKQQFCQGWSIRRFLSPLFPHNLRPRGFLVATFRQDLAIISVKGLLTPRT